MRRVYGAKVMRLTPGDLPDCFELGTSRGVLEEGQKSAEANKPQRTAVRAEREEPNRFDAIVARSRRRQES